MRGKSEKVAVVGAGPMGLAIAYELILKGYKPEIFEADNRLGGMASCFDFEEFSSLCKDITSSPLSFIM